LLHYSECGGKDDSIHSNYKMEHVNIVYVCVVCQERLDQFQRNFRLHMSCFCIDCNYEV